MWRCLRNRRLILRLHCFQGTHIFGASHGGPCDSVTSCFSLTVLSIICQVPGSCLPAPITPKNYFTAAFTVFNQILISKEYEIFVYFVYNKQSCALDWIVILFRSKMDQNRLLEFASYVTNLKMFPYFDAAHYVVMCLMVRDDNGALKHCRHSKQCLFVRRAVQINIEMFVQQAYFSF